MERNHPDRAKEAPAGGPRVKNGPAIELRHLRYFLVVSEELHFRRAAERLYMSQPPLSHAIRKLEEELGVQLLNRTSRAVSLTDAGRALAEEARKVLASVDHAVAESQRAGGEDSNLRVGFAPYLATDLLVRFLGGLHRREPRARLQFRHLLAHEQIGGLQRGELDFGIFANAYSAPKLQTEPLFPGEPLAAFLMPDHPLAEKPVLGPDDFADEILVSFQPAARFAAWLDEVDEAGYRFQGVHEVGSDRRDCILAVASGAGVALLPSSSLEGADAGTIVVRRPLDPPLVTPETVVAWREPPPAQLQALTDDVREVARTLRAEYQPS